MWRVKIIKKILKYKVKLSIFVGSMKKKLVKSKNFSNMMTQVMIGVNYEQKDRRGLKVRDPMRLPVEKQRPMVAAFYPNPSFMKK